MLVQEIEPVRPFGNDIAGLDLPDDPERRETRGGAFLHRRSRRVSGTPGGGPRGDLWASRGDFDPTENGGRRGLPQRAMHRPLDGAEHPVWIPEADLDLGGVHIHIHLLRRQLHPQEGPGIAAGREQGVIGLQDRGRQHTILHPASVHEEGQLLAIRPIHAGRADPAIHPNATGFLRHLQEGIPLLNPVKRRQTVAGFPGGRQREDLPAIVAQDEVDMGISQGVARDPEVDLPPLRPFPLQELQPRRGVEEEILHNHLRPGRAGDGVLFQDLPPFDAELRAYGLPGSTGSTGHAGDGRDRRKGLPPETQGGHPEQILRRGELAGGVPRESQGDLRHGDPTTVVGHPDPPAPPAFGFHLDPGSAGIQGVLHQLLHHRGRALDHLSRRDLRHQPGIQDPNRHPHAPRSILTRIDRRVVLILHPLERGSNSHPSLVRSKNLWAGEGRASSRIFQTGRAFQGSSREEGKYLLRRPAPSAARAPRKLPVGIIGRRGDSGESRIHAVEPGS
ncbi:hypothetical protein HRbin22_00566 [Candidatus Thermoflexus japonica]|uniref:Uncharacterized protein n=1 Tax=Candidatus Thermoflexus japonica TaxID=2035417 RepID=A0A2H5Y4K5_9CHLR|nr:hypothetical protein HRbin22_00566 [Candidatus Thermoflexus japonica]